VNANEKLEGSISIISSDPQCKNGNAQFTNLEAFIWSIMCLFHSGKSDMC